MPYQPYDTGWIKSIYSMICLGWFLFSTGLLPRFSLYSFHNNMYLPFSRRLLIILSESIGNAIICIGKQIIQYESILFHKCDYMYPVYKTIKYVKGLFPTYDGGRPPSFKYLPSNVRLRKTSSGRHLASYFARKRMQKQKQIISGSTKKNDNCYYGTDKSQKTESNSQHRSNHEDSSIHDFHPMDNPSCHDNTWYDAISPYWTGGMV
jgi:hypothetical protein